MDPQITPAPEPAMNPAPANVPVTPGPVQVAAPPAGAAPINVVAKKQGLVLGIISLALFVAGL